MRRYKKEAVPVQGQSVTNKMKSFSGALNLLALFGAVLISLTPNSFCALPNHIQDINHQVDHLLTGFGTVYKQQNGANVTPKAADDSLDNLKNVLVHPNNCPMQNFLHLQYGISSTMLRNMKCEIGATDPFAEETQKSVRIMNSIVYHVMNESEPLFAPFYNYEQHANGNTRNAHLHHYVDYVFPAFKTMSSTVTITVEIIKAMGMSEDQKKTKLNRLLPLIDILLNRIQNDREDHKYDPIFLEREICLEHCESVLSSLKNASSMKLKVEDKELKNAFNHVTGCQGYFNDVFPVNPNAQITDANNGTVQFTVFDYLKMFERFHMCACKIIDLSDLSNVPAISPKDKTKDDQDDKSASAAAAADEESTGLSTGAIVGIVLGCVGGIVLIIAIIYFVRRSKNNSQI